MNRILAETDWLYFTSMGLPVSLILIIPFPIAFILTFRKFDIRPALTFNRKLFKHLVLFLIPALAFSFLVGYLGTREYSQGYYLTLDNKLIENNWIFNSVKIYDQNKVVKINTYFNLWPSFEIDHYVIGGMFESQQFEKKFVVRKLDLKNSEIKSIYETTASKYVGFWKFNKEVLLIEEGENSTTFTLVIIDVISGEARRIEANLPSAGYSFPQIFGTDKLENRRFWLVSSKEEMNRSVWRLWEDGELESLGYSYRLPPFYINRMLFLYTEDGIDACIIDSIGKKMFREISDSVAFSSLNRKDLSNDSLTEIYGRQGQKIVRLDLKNFEISEIGDYEGAIFNNFPGDFYFIKMSRDDRTITELYHLKDGRMKFLQEFFLKKSKTNKPWDQFYIFKTGIVATKKRKVTVFAFPDMKVLKLKGL